MSARRSSSRPSEVLALPESRPRQAPAASVPDSPAPTPDGPAERSPATRARLVVAVMVSLLAGAIGVSAIGPTPPATSGARPIIDIATEDAVVSVLMVFQAESTLTDAVMAGTSIFAVPGAAARSRAITTAADQVGITLLDLDGTDTAEGTPGETYLAHADHVALIALADDLAVHAATLGFLGDVHDSVHGGVGLVSLPAARQSLVDDVLTRTATPDASTPSTAATTREPQPASQAWAQALVADIDSVTASVPPDPATANQRRLDADAEWRARAARIGPAAGDDLAAFLNGIDPAVLAALDGHPVAGPALRRLR